MQPGDLAKRCSAIGLYPAQLARLANVHADTVDRALNDRNRHGPRGDILNKLTEVVQGEERRILRHLAALHPQEAIAAICPERKP